MQRSGTFTKTVPTNDGPYLSFNPKITSKDDIGHQPDPDKIELMKSIDPPLSSTWVIWEQRKQSEDSKDYADAMKQTVSFSTVKEFWACWNHLPQPSMLLSGKKFIRDIDGQRHIIDSLAIFRKGVQPEWEDPENCKGAHFLVTLKPNLGGGLIDELWNNVVLGMVSDSIKPASMITGVRLVDKLAGAKPVLRIELWFNKFDQETMQGGQGDAYDLRGSFESCMRLKLDGQEKQVSWGRTDIKPHFATK
mmetsp:Transcript_25493/g.51025  ORF Transcript_25493/g.51025 Transcript_25493/m.51025 type:complete len:249 (-) Transcript_25493:66-812(-)